MKKLLVSLCVLAAIGFSQAGEIAGNLNLPVGIDGILLNASGERAAQAFTTGPDPVVLDSVTVRLKHFGGGSSSARIFLLADFQGTPSSLLIADLGEITNFTSASPVNQNVVSSSRPYLEPSTRYWVVVENVTGDFSWLYSGNSTSTGEGSLLPLRATRVNGETDFTPRGDTGNLQNVSVIGFDNPSFTVSTTADSGVNSLRQAILNANVAPGIGRIGFASQLAGATIRLNGAELVIDSHLVIDASALPGGIAISGDRTDNGPSPDDSRVFTVAGRNHQVSMDSLIIIDGRAKDGVNGLDGQNGGGILNESQLTLTRMVIANNAAGDGSDESGGNVGDGGDGGGLYSTFFVKLVRSSFFGNRAGKGGDGSALSATDGGKGGDGGAIYNRSFLEAERCTISLNRSGDGGEGGGDGFGGIGGDGGAGGGIFCEDGPVSFSSVSQTTLTNNLTGDGGEGGAGNTGGSGGNGGALFGEDAFSNQIESTLSAGNTTGAGGGNGGQNGIGPDINGFTVSEVNLVGSNAGVASEFPAGLPNANGDFIGSAASPLDAFLGPFADNGGPTFTHLPLPGSPAIDPIGGATSDDSPIDQRGAFRIAGGVMDIGAVEVGGFAAAAAAAEAAQKAAARSALSRKIAKLKKKFKKTKRKGKVAKAKKLRKKIKKLTKQLRAL